MPAAKRPSKPAKRRSKPAKRGSTTKRLSDYRRPQSKKKKAPAKRRRPPARRSWAWRYRRVLFLVGLLGATAVAGVAYLIARVPLPPDVVSSQTTLLTDASGARLAELHGTENRLPVHLDKVPKSLQDAVIAAED